MRLVFCSFVVSSLMLALPAGADLPDHACAVADAENPVYYESSSAVWSWSPDGALIVYDRGVGDVSQLRVRQLASGNVACITSGKYRDTQPNWSPAGDRIAFVREVDGIPRVHILDVKNGSTQPLIESQAGTQYPSFSRDGSMLAYVRLVPGDSRRRFVVVRDIASGEEREVFDSPFGLNDLNWSADNTTVLFFSIDDDGWNDIYAARADGTGTRRLTDNTVTDSYSPEYSPDGARLLFGQGSEDSVYSRWYNYDLYEKDLASGTVRRMTWAYGPDDRARYSPDGRWIGFASSRSGYIELYVMDFTGKNLRAMTYQPEGELAGYVRTHGVAAGRAYFDATRRKLPNAKLIGERAAVVLTRQLIARGQPQDAANVARMGVATYPDAWAPLSALGEALLASGDRDGALEVLRRSLTVFPNQVQLVFLLGFEDFFALLDSVEGIWQDKALALFELSNWLQRRGDFLSALVLLQRLDAAHPDDEDVLSRLADTHLLLGDHPSAVATYRRVLELNPDNDEARVQLARIQSLGHDDPRKDDQG